MYLCVYVSLKIKDYFRLMRPVLEHSVTHNATIPKDLLKILWLTGSLFWIDTFIFCYFYIELCYF